MKLLVTGRQGQVVRSVIERSGNHAEFEALALGRPQFDLADGRTIAHALETARPDMVISAAAYTAVDQAEDEPELAQQVNAIGPGLLAAAAAQMDIPIIHVSTDYVFSGTSAEPYSEKDRPDPRSVYGRTKLAGEEAVAAANPQHVILRTAWVYSPFGKNFVKTMLRLASERDEIAVVSDQWGNPTSALDVADGILHIADSLGKEPSGKDFGIFHLAGTGNTTWSGLAEKAMEVSQANGGPFASIKPITTAEFPTRARRPANSRLATDKLAKVYGWEAPDWQHSVEATVIRLLQPSDNQS